MSYPPSETIGYMIGERLLELRTSAGLTQPEFAAIAGTTKQYVGRLEKGFNKDPNPKLVELWARHFGGVFRGRAMNVNESCTGRG